MDNAFSNLRATFLNCSLKTDASESHTMHLVRKVSDLMKELGATTSVIHLNDYDTPFGMTTDASKEGSVQDDWPKLQQEVDESDILVIASPIWLGNPSSIASLVVERLYAGSAETNAKGQYRYYGKVGGCIVTGNEDGVKAVSKQMLYALQHIGYTIPPQADCGWIGEIGPGYSYGDIPEDGDTPVGYDSDFTNKQATIMTWNLLHMAKLLQESDGIPATGTTLEGWDNGPHIGAKKD